LQRPVVDLANLAPCSAFPEALFCEDWSSGLIRHQVWKHEVAATGGGNGEFQLYSQHPQNSFVVNGSLHIRPSWTYHTSGDLRGDLDLTPQGCTTDWNNGCRSQGSLHVEAGNPGGKLWTASITTPEEAATIDEAIAAAGLPACEKAKANGACNTMVPVGGLRQRPVMSAKLLSRASFTYGRVEITATLPRGHSLWPALWMMPSGQSPWPTSGEIDICESMGNEPGTGFALDYRSTSAAVHFGEKTSWYDLAYTPTYERLRGVPFGSTAGRQRLADGPHTFGLYWGRDNLYVYVDGDANRVLDMDQVFRLSAENLLKNLSLPEERRALAEDVSRRGYAAGWSAYSRMSGKHVPEWLWRGRSEGAPFDRPYHLIMNLAVGGDFFKGNLNPDSPKSAMWDIPIGQTGQLPAMYWYSRMKTWWHTWAKDPAAEEEVLHPSFRSAGTSPAAFLETRNTWTQYASGGQDAGRASVHKADTLAAVPPPPDEAIGAHVDFRIHRVLVLPVEGSSMVDGAQSCS